MPGPSVSFSDHPDALAARVRAEAQSLGFDAVGIARADVSLDRDVERYDAFVAAGMHGDMHWLAQHRAARARVDGDEVLRGARSVICLARRYGPSPAEPAGVGASIAAYARGRDYHKFMRKRIRRLAAFVRSLGTPAAPVHARPLCDDAPVLERAWAARAGLGFVGKNGLLIVPGVGSMVLLGEVVTTLELPAGAPMADRCGACTRCLQACPTDAFAAPFVLDARRCISYLTIELQQGSAVEPELRGALGARVFGCDACQTVCPFNAGVGPRAPLWDEDGDPFAPLERWSRVRLEHLLALDAAAWDQLSEGTPLRRAGRVRLARSAAIALGNAGHVEARAALHAAATSHDDATVREAASWALERLPATPGPENT
jgi:epoxyqueuosine reductase